MKFLILALASVVFSVSAMAADTSDGCGLGWQVTSKTSFSATTTRGTTNAFIPPTFGMTSGTLGCAQHSIAKKEEAAAIYAVNNYDALSIEMASGQGEVLTGFARTLGCSDSAVQAFGSMAQKNYAHLVQSGEQPALNLFKRVKAEIQQDSMLSASCGV